MSRKIFKKGFSQAELLATIAVLGCIFALGIGMFNASKMNSNIDQTRQARLDSAIRTATMSILGKDKKLPASTACNAGSLRDLLKTKIAGATDATVRVNGADTSALRVKGLGTIAVATSSDCINQYTGSSMVPIALYTSPEDDIAELTVPDAVVVTDEKAAPKLASVKAAISTPSNDTLDVVAYGVSSTGLEETYSSPTTAELASAKGQPALTGATVSGNGSGNGATERDFPNHEPSICVGGTYINPAGDYCEGKLVVEFYQKWNINDGCEKELPLCPGNGQAANGDWILTGQVNNMCAINSTANDCSCPQDEQWWVPGTYYTIEGAVGKDGKRRDIAGMCIRDCALFDPHMVGDPISNNCQCDEENGYEWNSVLKRCVIPGTCPEEYLTWDADEGTCVCDEDYVMQHLENDEVYTGEASEECKKKCDESNYWYPNKDKTDCERHLPECECLKELNYSDYSCSCKKVDDLNNAALQQCNVNDNQYYTGVGTCVSNCDDPYNSYKVRDTQNIQACVCQATKPASMTLGSYEAYDPTSTMTCRKCDTAYPNREYANDVGPGACICKDINDPTLQIGNDQYYDITQPNCVSTCPQGEVPNLTRTGCQPNCGCLEKLVNGVCVCNTEITTAEIQACADFRGDIFDPNSPTCQTPCNGTSHADSTLKECICDGCAQKYNGTTCICDEATSTAHHCLGNDEKYDANSSTCKSCASINRTYNNNVCECKPASQVIFSDVNMKYDITQPNCESPCSGILVRDRNNPSQCVCPSAKPSTFGVNAGYHYNNLAIATGCVSPCPKGDYCPGSNPSNPSTPAIDPQDPNPTIDTTYPEGDVYKCPCGTYGASEGLSRATCTATCPAGTKCTTPGTINPVACSGSELCLPGVMHQCNPSSCGLPMVPNTDHTGCVCSPSKPSAYSLPAGYKYDSTQPNCIKPCPAGDYCPGSKPGQPDVPNVPTAGTDPLDPSPVMDGNDPFAYKCPCGKYSSGSIDSKTSACMGDCYKGYYCTKGSTTPTQNVCTASQKCPVGLNTCAPESCALPMVPNTDQTACVCSPTKPSTYSLQAGYKYDATQPNCIKPCPAGDYCPGSKPGQPDVPNVPTAGTDPLDPSPVMDGNDPFAYKCPCGKYSSGSTDSKTSACMGNCTKGYYCTKGSTTPTQNKCTAQQKCPTGLNTCQPEECTLPYVPNPEQTSCVCSRSAQAAPAGKYFKAETCEYIDCPTGHYCPGGNNPPRHDNPEPDPNYPGGVIYCPCGMYQDITGASECKTDCALGYYCPKGSTSNKGYVNNQEHKCTTDQKCPVGTCQPQGCILPMVPNANQTACVCAEGKPGAYSLPAGYKYDSTQPNCIKPCPAGDYCPGSKPGYPAQPNIPTVGTDPLDPSPVMDDNDPFAYKCPCGKYSSGSTDSKTSACMGNCHKGYYCTKGSTTPTQNQCNDLQKCPEGLATCYPDSCTFPYLPNFDQTECVCSRSAHDTPAGKYFKAETCEYIDCPIGHYCPGGNNPPKHDNPEPDPNYPSGVIYCPCGLYQDTVGMSECKTDCALGYKCPKGSTTNKGLVNNQEHPCSANEKCPVGPTCVPDTCATPFVPNANQTGCICSQTRPSGYPLTAGYTYSPNYPANGCMVACSAGHYCPGSKPGQPDVPNVPTGTTPTDDDPFVFVCPCGTYSSGGATSKDANCMGQCTKGYYCTQGSTTPTQHKCNAQQKCPTGLNTCQPQECALPMVPNTDQTACVCAETKPSAYSLPAGYKYDKTQPNCIRPCPAGDYCPGSKPGQPSVPNVPTGTTPTADDPFVFVCPCGTYSSGGTTSIDRNCMGQCTKGYYCTQGSTTPTQHKCSAQQKCPTGLNTCQPQECTAPYIPNYDQTGCICGLSPNNVPKGKYFDANKCEYVACPTGHYCPGSNPDPNPSPVPDPNYPSGVIFCPCGTYGSATGLQTHACSGQCPIGYYCPQGSTNARAHSCSAGQSCHVGTCEPDVCAFPTTSAVPYETCNKCMLEADIKNQQADYFKKNEIWVNDVNKACKKCKSNMVPVAAGGCDCPADKPYWYNEECNSCEHLGKLYFIRNDKASMDSSCKLVNYIKGDQSCFDGSDGRIIPDDMKNMANRLIAADKNKTFENVFAYVIADNNREAKVIGVFTISSWYAAFPSDFVSEDESTFASNRVTGTCSQMCAGINSAYSSLCVSTCEKFKNNVNTMFDHCSYVGTNLSYFGQTLGNRSDELCVNGEIKLANNCVYDIGSVFRKRKSPLVFDLLGNGFEYTSVEEGVIFDLDNDGNAEQTAWLAPQTEFDNAFLILDKNKNGQVDNGGELFGDQNGEENGFKELAKYDSNGDKLINKEDPIYTELRLWADMNKNAKIDYEADGTSKEIKTLEEAGITEISTDYQKLLDKKGNVLEDMYGNLVGIMGQFKMMIQNAAGKLVETVRKVMDVFFVTK